MYSPIRIPDVHTCTYSRVVSDISVLHVHLCTYSIGEFVSD